MKKIFILFIIFVVHPNNAQTFEQKVADKSCECLKSKKKLNEEIIADCIANSITKEIVEKQNKDIDKISTVDGITSTIKTVKEILYKQCDITKNPLEEKKDIFYADSKNKTAYSFYQTSTDMMEQDDFKNAIEGFLIAIQNDSKFVKAYDHLAICYRKINDYDNAIKYYKESLKLFPEGDLALMNLGVIYRIKEDYKESIQYYQKLIEYYPQNAEGYFGLGQNYLMMDDEENGLDNLFKAYSIYTEENSDYKKDAEQIIQAIYDSLKSKGKEDVFKRIASENNVTLE